MSHDKSQAYRDGQIHCFSFANGLGRDIPSGIKRALDGPDNDERKAARALARYMILDKLQLVGVAVTNFDAKNNSAQDMQQGFVGNLSGLNTIVNTGDSQIRAGDYVPGPSMHGSSTTTLSQNSRNKKAFSRQVALCNRSTNQSSAASDAVDLIGHIQNAAFANDLQVSGNGKIISELKKFLTPTARKHERQSDDKSTLRN